MYEESLTKVVVLWWSLAESKKKGGRSVEVFVRSEIKFILYSSYAFNHWVLCFLNTKHDPSKSKKD
ncbi:hypothetical protein HanRHA438_Chr12g0548141 [Helianthus annuus]|nr:hypothetical protein HanRHA438_Chr12g0548141 [Helianthus annuus]